MKKRILPTVLACVLIMASFAACGGGGSGGSGGGGGGSESGDSSVDLRAWVASTPETIDPALNSSADGGTYLTHLMQGLYRYKWDGTGVEFGDAESVEISDDGMTWIFTLRDDIVWSDGEDVTAYDYEYAWKRLCDPAVAAPYAFDMGGYLLNGIAVCEGDLPLDELGVTALDEKTLQVDLEGPCAFFDQIAVFSTFAPVREDMIEANGDSWWHNPDTFLTNGPFVMTEFSIDERLVMVPSETYYDRDKIVPDSITWLFLTDEDTALSAFRSGEVDIINSVPLSEIASLKAEGVFDLRPLLGTYYLDFNLDLDVFKDVNVRKALTLAIDRDYICDVVNSGTRVPATAFVGDGYGDVDQAKDFRAAGGEYIGKDLDANREAAKQALADAGYPDGEGFPTMEYMYNTSSGHQSIAEAIQNDWQEVLGINITLVNQEWEVFLETRRVGDYEIARDGWLSDYNDASSLLQLQYSSSGNNNARYNNPAYDKLLDEAKQMTNREDYIGKMHAAEKIMMEEWAVCPIFYYNESYAVSKELKNWYSIPLGYTFMHLASK